MLIQRPARAWASLRPPVRRAVICARAPQRSAHRRRAIGERSGPATDSKQLREHRACIFVNRRYYRREETDQQWNYTIACSIPDSSRLAPRAGAGDRAYRPRFASRRARSGGANTNRNDARAVAIFECRGLLDEEMRGCPYRVCLFTSFE